MLNKNFLVDSHCHLNYPSLIDSLPQVVADCNSINLIHKIKILQTICTQHQDIPIILNIIQEYPNIFGSIGLHPNNVTDETSEMSLEFLLQQIQNLKIIGIGETGLDYFNKTNMDLNLIKSAQIKSFFNHVQAAQISQLGLIIHSRNAEEDTYEILFREMKNKEFKAVLHCFTGSKEFASKLLDLGCFISFSGIITFKNAKDLQDIVKFVPIDRMLIETDSPYLAPAPYRGKSNQPSYVYYVAEAVASLKNISLDNVAMHTTENFFKVFNATNKVIQSKVVLDL